MELLLELVLLIRGHVDLAREGKATVDGGALHFQLLLGIGRTLAHHVELCSFGLKF